MARDPLTGSRIRERRLARGMRQAALAKAVGVSASYLNLIEHNRRAIGGALITRIADELETSHEALTGAGDDELLDALAAAAAARGMADEDVAAAPALARRFPAWARLVVGQARETAAARARIEALSDRMANDPALAEAMHELLSTVATVRSTASILAQTPELDAMWLERFHGNLDADSRRLASGAEAVVSYLDRQAETADTLLPIEAARQAVETIPPPKTDAEIEAVVAEMPDEVRPLIRAHLRRERADAAALPDLPPEQGSDPLAAAAASGQPPARALRRAAALDPALGLVVCDAAGAILRRRVPLGFALPVIGAGCPLWPLFSALSRPLHPLSCRLEMPDGGIWIAQAAVEVVATTAQGPVLEATMLLRRAGPEDAGGAAPHPVGPACRVCPRPACPARREPSLVPASEAASDAAPASGA